MLGKIIINDLKENRVLNIILTIFMTMASFLLAMVLIGSIYLYQSVGEFTKITRVPDFLQMHTGHIDLRQIDEFSRSNDLVSSYQVLDFLNIETSDIVLNGDPLSLKTQDNGFTYQSDKFDYLVDTNNQIAYPKRGEVYVPLAYLRDGIIKKGDNLKVGKVNFFVKGPIRDGQMSSMLASSKRFLINKSDYEKIKDLGREEYLIEFLLKDYDKINDFQTAYVESLLPANGPAISLSIIKLVNSLEMGIGLGIMVLMEILILSVSILCVKVAMNSRIEDEFRLIGILRAIGLAKKKIKKIYLSKYAILALGGGILGFVLAIFASQIFIDKISLLFGIKNFNTYPYILAGILVFGLIAFIIAYLYSYLDKINEISIVKAISVDWTRDSANKTYKKLRDSKSNKVGWTLDINNIKEHARTYGQLLVIASLLVFANILPLNIYNSIKSDDFISYMGLANADILVAVKDKAEAYSLYESLSNNSKVDGLSIYEQGRLDIISEDGSVNKLLTSTGDHSKYRPKYFKGRPPQREDEIALSYLYSHSLAKELNDELTVAMKEGRKTLRVSGVYSDITNGGKTSKVNFSLDQVEGLASTLIIDVADSNLSPILAKEIRTRSSASKVYLIEDYKHEVLGDIINNTRIIARLASILSLGLILLIFYLFSTMIIKKDSKEISALKAIGFTKEKIKKIYYSNMAILGIMSLVIGSGLAYILGGKLVEVMLKNMGIAQFSLTIRALDTLIILPILTITLILGATYISNKAIDQVKISDFQKD